MKSTDKLRKELKNLYFPLNDNTSLKLISLVDEIEAEIAKRFMELPVDADGVPIRVGETVYGKHIRGNPEYIVSGFEFDTKHDQWNIKTGAASSASQGLLSHVKPRTLEDVLEDLVIEHDETDGDRGIITKYAAEIRELLGERNKE